ncbi:hypothetical protein QAD02_020038 [Eretmocerus hayati]|uniref:Uncharacterized protein n=1 Tax=Eretmocerus hayati TaxID=131215 RepID=A0ACC2PL81_9HYME|nr:hypothetical protein QAD02_020038 [Eretmocerus hayati]
MQYSPVDQKSSLEACESNVPRTVLLHYESSEVLPIGTAQDDLEGHECAGVAAGFDMPSARSAHISPTVTRCGRGYGGVRAKFVVGWEPIKLQSRASSSSPRLDAHAAHGARIPPTPRRRNRWNIYTFAYHDI